MSDKTSIVTDLKTWADPETGRITSDLINKMDGETRRLSQWVVETRDTATRIALIQLGWTPPKEHAT